MNLPIPDQQSYLSAKPFPHCVIDNIFPTDQLHRILSHWPKEHEHLTKNEHEVSKGATISERAMGEPISDFIHCNFQSQEFILFLEELTGINGLVFNCRRFGLHETFPTGKLMPHIDYTICKHSGLQLRVNVILYLNQNWNHRYGGDLELYDALPKAGALPVVSIEPLFNRTTIFTMNAATPAWHGHPRPLNTPDGVTRKSIALNYFTLPEKGVIDHRTTFSNEKKSIFRDLLPPILYRRLLAIKTK